jgi:hypothetical protein
MNNIKRLVFLMIVAVAISSCDLLNVDVDTTMTGVLSIDVEESMAKAAVPGHPFDAIKTLNPKDDADVEKYASQIVGVGVENISAEVTSVTGTMEEVIVYSGAQIIIADGGLSTTWELPEDWLMAEGNVFMLDSQGDFYSEVEDILTDVEEFTIQMKGNSSVHGITMTVKFNIDAVVTGSPF